MKIIILGASGQIGSIIYNGLSGTHEVIGTSRKVTRHHLRFDPFQDDWSVLANADVLINCVGQIQSTSTSSFHHIHTELTKHIIARREQIGMPAIIQISALGASPEQRVEFLRTKGIADDLLLHHPDTAVIRPSIVCTHGTMIVKKMIMLARLSRFTFGVLPVPNGLLQTRIQPIMPEDLLDLVRKMCYDRNPRIVDAVGPEAITFNQIIRTMMASRQQRLRTIEVSKQASDVIIKRFVSRALPALINAQQYQLLFQDNVSDVQMAERMLGRPLMSTRQFFKDEFSHAAN